MSKLEDIEKDITRLTAEAKFSAWLDQLEAQLRAAGVGSRGAPTGVIAPETSMTAGTMPGPVTEPGPMSAAAGPSQVISFRRDPRRLRRGRSW